MHQPRKIVYTLRVLTNRLDTFGESKVAARYCVSAQSCSRSGILSLNYDYFSELLSRFSGK
jgi:hypothetical protein